MSTAFRPLTVRPLITLLALSLLVASALVALSSETRAGAPQPTGVINDVQCQATEPTFTNVYLSADVAYKGRWVDVSWSVSLNRGAWSEVRSSHRDSRQPFIDSETLTTLAQEAQARIDILDRGEIVATYTSPVVPCA